jgi:hypothetical protein
MATSSDTTTGGGPAGSRKATAGSRKATTTPKHATASQAARSKTAPTATTTSTHPANPVERAQVLAERAVLVPIGATLLVRDSVVSTVKDLASSYSTRAGIERELERYERRGSSARTRLERRVRRERTRVERDLRQRRARLERAVRQNRRALEREVRSVRKDLARQSDLVTGRVEKLISDTQELIGSIS